MSIQEERLRILKMVEEGKLAPEQAAQLLAALKESTEEGPSDGEGRKLRWLRIRVMEHNGTKVNVSVPWGLVKVGLRLAERYGALDEGTTQEVLKALEEASGSEVSGRIVEVEADDGTRVEIYVE